VAVAVFDADVLIGYLVKDDANHRQAVERMRRAFEPETRRLLSAVSYGEVLIGPLRSRGAGGAAIVDSMLRDLRIEIVAVDPALARRAAEVRLRTGLKLPDAYALAAAVEAREHGESDVRVESFDTKVADAFVTLEPHA
jgi:predicted nucleic acid-binding protein